MAYLILGLAMFFSIHIVPMAPAMREWTRALLSVWVYLLVFSLVSALALILIIIGYGQVRWQARLDPELWAPPIWLRHVTMQPRPDCRDFRKSVRRPWLLHSSST
jgi:uncharacterized membrane protein